jgi:hypothetical protein
MSFAAINASSTQPLFVHNTNGAGGYAAVGWLAERIFSNPTADQNRYISWAMRDILNPLVSGDPSKPGVLSQLNTGADTATDKAKVAGWESKAFSNKGSLCNYSGLTLYTPTSLQTGWTDGRPQEMILKTPEAPGLALLGLDMSGLIGLLAVLRRRIRRRE